jgi:hypothetical protein
VNTSKASCSTHEDESIIAVVGVIGGVMLPQLVLDALLRGAVAENTSIPREQEGEERGGSG